ncbi:hypothetical protein JL722_11548 [Aureococcus anophagefferens]|nr:hypothetical protein JL722_11548 [Aureococcus anophagefferens]
MAASPRPAGGERRAAAGVALGLAGAALGVSLVRAAAGAQRLEVASLAAGASGSVGARRGAARSLCLDYCAGVGSRDAACDICAVASFVHLHNAYEDAAGKPREGYYPQYLAEVLSAGAYASLALEVRARGGAIYAYAYAFDVTVKHVRREIRRLTDADRGRFLDALQLMYSTPQDVGEALYGPKFKSGNYLVRKHLYGAASKDCDHWHDDAGVAPRRK